MDYSRYNYDELVEIVTRALAEKGEWKDAYQSSTGQVLIQAVAAITERLHYMLERRTQEAYLPTARLKTSVSAISNLIGYRPRRVVSSAGTLSLTLRDDSNAIVTPQSDIVIPKYSMVSLGEYRFVIVDEVNISPLDKPPYTFLVKEGVVRGEDFDPNDVSSTLFKNNYIILKNYETIENDSFFIYTDTQEFRDVRKSYDGVPALESIAFAGPNDNVYDIRVTNEGLQILFGNGINGAKPEGTLHVQWIESSGPRVKIVSTGNRFQLEQNRLYDDSIPQNSYGYELINIEPIDGGNEAESIESIKRNAPNYIRTNARAVTKSDYRFWALQSGVGGIIDCAVYGEEELGVSVVRANNVFVTYLTRDGSTLSFEETQRLREYLNEYKTVTTHLVIQPAEIIPLQLNVRLKRSKSVTAPNSEIYEFVKTKLIEMFALKEGSLANHVYLSDIINYISSLEIVKEGIGRKISDYVTVNIKGIKEFNSPFETTDDTLINITYGNHGDIYRTNINDRTYMIPTTSLDSAETVAERLSRALNTDPEVTAKAVGNTVTVGLDTRERRNYILFSEGFEKYVWQKERIDVIKTDDRFVNGVSPVYKLAEDDDVGRHGISQSGIRNGSKTFSIKAKAGERSFLTVIASNDVDGDHTVETFDLDIGVSTNGIGQMEYIEDGWYKCTLPILSSTASDTISVLVNRGNGSPAYDGSIGSGIFITEAQLSFGNDTGGYVKTEDVPAIKAPASEPYTIHFTGSTNQDNLEAMVTIHLPIHDMRNEERKDMLLRNSIEVITENGTVLGTDDGNGNLMTGTVDYVTGTAIIPLPRTGKYYVRFSQNIDNNFIANSKQAFVYELPKDNYSDPVNRLSTIEIIN